MDLSSRPTTRQTLFDVWDGALSEVGLDEFADGFMPTVVGSSFSDAPTSPQPGQLFWHISENVMYAWHDQVDNTGVSLWLAIGPDKFETACLTEEPIPAGYPVELRYDRKVRVERSTTIGQGAAQALPVVFGFCQSGINSPVGVNNPRTDDSGVTFFGGDTSASGSWIRVGVDGIVFGALTRAESAASGAFNDFTNGEWITLRDIAGEEPSIIGFSGEPLLFNTVGMSTQWGQTSGGATISEPTYIMKFIFAPRASRQGNFRD